MHRDSRASICIFYPNCILGRINDIRLIACCTLVGILALAIVGMDWVTRVQMGLLVILHFIFMINNIAIIKFKVNDLDTSTVPCLVIYVTSFSSISHCNNSEFVSKTCTE